MHCLNKIRCAPRRNLAFYGLLLSISVLLILFLLNAALPWEKGIAARQLAGKTVKIEHYAITGLWYGSLLSLVIFPILAVIGRIGLKGLSPSFTRLQAGLGRTSSPAFLLLAAIAISIAASQMFPRLDSRLWSDEDYTTRRAIIGQLERNSEDETQKPLHVNIGQLALARLEWPELMAVLEDPEFFKALDPLYGLQSGCNRYIFRYLGKASLPNQP